MIVGVVLVVLIIGAVGVYFMVFKKQQPEVDPAQLALTIDTDGDGFKDVDEKAKGTDHNDPKRFPGSHKKVLFAKTDIATNSLIRDNMVDVREVAAKGEAPDAALLEADRSKVVGHISAIDIKAGEYVVDAMVYGGRPQLSFLVPKYKRAISLRYDQLAAVTGLIQLGDLVDVIGHFKVRRREGGELDYTRVLVQNARVVALGQMFMPKPPGDTSPTPAPTGLTLSIYPHEAERLVWSENYQGTRLTMALRSPANDALARTPGVTDDAVFGRMILNDAREIEVYYGGIWGGVTRFERRDGDRLGLGRMEGSNLEAVKVDQ
jgi:Flp pilus assembly protein CpaB